VANLYRRQFACTLILLAIFCFLLIAAGAQAHSVVCSGGFGSILKSVDEGKGTLGQLLQSRSLFDHADQTMDQAQQLIKGMRENLKKCLVIRLKLF
jgi:hypothetical protein